MKTIISATAPTSGFFRKLKLVPFTLIVLCVILGTHAPAAIAGRATDVQMQPIGGQQVPTDPRPLGLSPLNGWTNPACKLACVHENAPIGGQRVPGDPSRNTGGSISENSKAQQRDGDIGGNHGTPPPPELPYSICATGCFKLAKENVCLTLT